MVRRYDAGAACVEELRRTCVSDGRSLAKQRTQRRRAERDDDLRLNLADLLFQPIHARGDLRLRGRFVDTALTAWFPLEMLYRIGHVDAVAADSRGQ